jgi:hypothetical protein
MELDTGITPDVLFGNAHLPVLPLSVCCLFLSLAFGFKALHTVMDATDWDHATTFLLHYDTV